MTAAGITLYRPVSLNRDYLTGKMLEKIAANHDKTWSRFSLERRGRVREAFLAGLLSLEESLATGSPAFLIDQARWQQARFAAENFPAEFAVTFFRIFKGVIAAEVPPDFREQGSAYARKAVSALRPGQAGPGTSPDTGTPLPPAARSFLNALLEGDPARGSAIIDKKLAAGVPVKEIYTGIFRPVLWETGKLWQQNRATIAQEHYVSGMIHRIMEQIKGGVTSAGKQGRRKKRVVASSVGAELHEIGIRMVADFFEMDGWDVYSTGANTPAKSILAAVRDHKADVLALSITMPSRLADLHYLIRSLRADKETAQVKVIVGGYPFRVLPDLWKQVGADAVAVGVEDAVAAADRLLAGNRKTA